MTRPLKGWWTVAVNTLAAVNIWLRSITDTPVGKAAHDA